jgi:hypothetical protein
MQAERQHRGAPASESGKIYLLLITASLCCCRMKPHMQAKLPKALLVTRTRGLQAVLDHG